MTAPVLALGLALAAGTLSAQDQGIGRFVPPSPAPGGFIHDGGPVLAPAELEQLNQRIEAHQSAGFGDIAVAILRDIGDYPAYEAGTAIYRAWGVGSQAAIGSDRRDLGVLLLVVPKELAPSGMGDCWITTGLGAEAHLTDGEAAAICRDRVIPRLREQDYAGAIGEGITGIAAALASLEPMSAVGGSVPPENDGGGVPGPLVVLLALGGAGGGVVAWRRRRRRKPRPCPAGHGPMRLLDEKADDAGLAEGQRKEESLKSVDYDVWQCPVCDERLVLRYKRWFTAYSQCPECGFWTVKSRTRTLVPATTSSGGLAETTRTCQQCTFTDTRQHATAKLSSSSSSSGGSSSSGRSFGGSGRTGGGGGGSRY